MIRNFLLSLLVGSLLILAALCSDKVEAAEPTFPWADIQPREGLVPHPSILTMILATEAIPDWKDSPPTMMVLHGQATIVTPHMVVNLKCQDNTVVGTLSAFSKEQAFAIARMYLGAMEREAFVALFADTDFSVASEEVYDACHGDGWYPPESLKPKGKGPLRGA